MTIVVVEGAISRINSGIVKLALVVDSTSIILGTSPRSMFRHHNSSNKILDLELGRSEVHKLDPKQELLNTNQHSSRMMRIPRTCSVLPRIYKLKTKMRARRRTTRQCHRPVGLLQQDPRVISRTLRSLASRWQVNQKYSQPRQSWRYLKS